jgi:hypothetical protein
METTFLETKELFVMSTVSLLYTLDTLNGPLYLEINFLFSCFVRTFTSSRTLCRPPDNAMSSRVCCIAPFVVL